MGATLRVDGVDVFVEGEGAQALVMVHGWPDTHRLWDAQVPVLRDRWRCVRFTLPGFDVSRNEGPRPSSLIPSGRGPGSGPARGALSRPRRALSLDETVAFLQRVIDAVSPSQPVALLLHDWGCVFGYEFAMRHPQRVSRLVGVDIGDAGSRAHAAELGARAKAGIFGYQVWLAAAWLVGGRLGDRMTRAMARWARCPVDPGSIGAQMNYPYFIQWSGRHGGYRRRRPVEPACPMLYVYGTRKPFMFHSKAWTEALARKPGCAVVALKTGHWVMCQAPAEFNRTVRDWLAQ